MTGPRSAKRTELEDILDRLSAAHRELMEALKDVPAEAFAKENPDGESVKRTLERTADDLNFYYGRLTARALTLPQPPCMQKADFLSIREAVMSLQVTHRRFSNLLHDLAAEDLDKAADDEEYGRFTLRQILEMAIAHYKLRKQQVQALAATPTRRRTRRPGSAAP